MNNGYRDRRPPPPRPARPRALPAADPEPAALDPGESWECVVCRRDVDAGTIPLLAGPALCSYGDGSVTKTVRDAEGNARVPVPVCPFKGGGR